MIDTIQEDEGAVIFLQAIVAPTFIRLWQQITQITVQYQIDLAGIESTVIRRRLASYSIRKKEDQIVYLVPKGMPKDFNPSWELRYIHNAGLSEPIRRFSGVATPRLLEVSKQSRSTLRAAYTPELFLACCVIKQHKLLPEPIVLLSIHTNDLPPHSSEGITVFDDEEDNAVVIL